MDLREDAPVERWVTVAQASELTGISNAAIRRGYRSGRIPTQRADGQRGAYLVPLSAVLHLGDESDEQGDDLGDPVVDLNASYWSLEAAAARDETAGVRAELAEVRDQLAFLRGQLAETSGAERIATARADAAEAELDELRAIHAAASSITDSSWLSLSTNRYESPVRSQGGAAPRFVAPAEVPAAALRSIGELPDLDDIDADVVDEEGTMAEHYRPGEHADDLLPTSEKKGRRHRH